MKCQLPAVAEAQHRQRTAHREVTADLLRESQANVLGDLLGAAHVRRDLGDGLENEIEVLHRYAFSEQAFQHRLQSGIRYV